MGENRLMQLRLRTPFELRCDCRVADQRAVLHAHHGPPERCAIANIDINAAQRGRRVVKLRDIWQIKECTGLGGHAIADGRRSNGMLNPIRLEAYAADRYRTRQRDSASITNRQAPQQALRFVGGINRAWCALGKPAGMIAMGMRQHDCRRRNGVQATEPIRAAIDHDTGVAVLNQQRTMASVPVRARLDLSARAKKPNVKNIALCRHFCCQAKLLRASREPDWTGSPGKISAG